MLNAENENKCRPSDKKVENRKQKTNQKKKRNQPKTYLPMYGKEIKR